MIFPDEIVSIISEYSKPLNRVQKSKYWIDHPVSYDEMITIIINKFELYIGSISRYFRVEHFKIGQYWCSKAWINGDNFLHCMLRFTMDDVIRWNGLNFEFTNKYVINKLLNLTEDIIYTIGVQEDRIVKIIKIQYPELKELNVQFYVC